MTALVVAIFVASLVGSLHCAGMCGAFVVLACGSGGGWSAALAQGAYHAGRLVSYVVLGIAAGAAGQLIDLSGSLAGIQPLATGLAGATMVAFGIAALLRAKGFPIAHVRLPQRWTRIVAQSNAAAMRRPPLVRAGLIGLSTTMLPCGWLYAFAVTAAGTASPLRGALVMAVFWAGTLPVLVVVGAGIRRLLGMLGAQAPTVTSLLLVAVGLYTLIGRAGMDPAAMAQSASAGTGQTPACCVSENDR